MAANRRDENMRLPESRRARAMRPQDDHYFGGPHNQVDDWDRRAFDVNPFDRREGQYSAGGNDFSERLRNLDGRDEDVRRQDPYMYGESYGGRPLDRPWERQNYRVDDGFAPRERRGIVENVKSFFGVGPKGYRRSDERIREDVCEALSEHPEVNAAEIEVRVKDGHVILTGTVDNRWMKRQAEDAVAYVSGVEDVRNELTIPRNTDASGDRARGTGRKLNS